MRGSREAMGDGPAERLTPEIDTSRKSTPVNPLRAEAPWFRPDSDRSSPFPSHRRLKQGLEAPLAPRKGLIGSWRGEAHAPMGTQKLDLKRPGDRLAGGLAALTAPVEGEDCAPGTPCSKRVFRKTFRPCGTGALACVLMQFVG